MYNNNILDFYNQKDSNGITNLEKINDNKNVMRRSETTPKDKSFEIVEGAIYEDYPKGMVVVDGKLIGFGINIFNEDVYPLQYFEIYCRNCELTGSLDISDFRDMVFLDVYNNNIKEIITKNNCSMRIFGVQNNNLETLDVTDMSVCQGIDAGKNKLTSIDVSKNPELVELYINDNIISKVDLTNNPKLKYFYCHNNKISKLNTRENTLLRHINATGNPLKEIQCIAPQSEPMKPLELYAKDGGYVGLKCNPVYNAQWKETGEWEQSYYAYPEKGFTFAGWIDNDNNIVSKNNPFNDEYGTSRVLYASFSKIEGN